MVIKINTKNDMVKIEDILVQIDDEWLSSCQEQLPDCS